jgi:hypothetical protein
MQEELRQMRGSLGLEIVPYQEPGEALRPPGEAPGVRVRIERRGR